MQTGVETVMPVTNIDLVRRFLEIVGEATPDNVVVGSKIDFGSLGKLLTHDFVIRNPLFHPIQGVFPNVGDDIDGSLMGVAGMQADIEATASHFEFSVSDADLKDAGDVVLFFGTINVTSLRSKLSMSSPFCELFFIKDNLISRIEPYINVNAFRLIL